MTQIYKPYAVYKNLSEFMQSRGVKTDHKPTSNDEFIKHITHYEYVKITGTRSDKHGTRPFILFLIAPDSKYATNTPAFKKLLNTISTSELNSKAEIVFISEKPLTNFIITFIRGERHQYPGLYIEHYDYKICIIVIPKHIMVPKHTILSDDKVKEFCDEFHTIPSRLPKILVTDPPIVWLGARPGDVIRIDRDSEITGSAIGYRVVTR